MYSLCDMSCFSAAFSFLCSQPRSNAPHTPRVILLGATGSGKNVQAALLANKYNLVQGEALDAVVVHFYVDRQVQGDLRSFIVYPSWIVFFFIPACRPIRKALSIIEKRS